MNDRMGYTSDALYSISDNYNKKLLIEQNI